MKIELITVRRGFNPAEDFCWVGPHATAIDPAKKKILLHTRKGELHKPGVWDIFSAPHAFWSFDGGQNWTRDPEPVKGLEDQLNGDWKRVYVGNPKLHRKSAQTLIIGRRVTYLKNRLHKGEPPHIEYATWQESSHSWTELKKLELTGVAEMQRLELPDGSMLLPVYRQGTAFVVKCAFDGGTLQIQERGNELQISDARGFAEPSIVYSKGRFLMTLRNDLAGYVATSSDGLNYSKPVKWTFDDGADLGNYNTQQHWVSHRDKLYLVYTRRDANNEHMSIVRHRAPLFMAEVDQENLCVIRSTEQIVVPERGAKLGNFDILDLTDNETWIIVAEWMEERPQLVSRNYGSDNSIFVAKITWDED